MNTVFKDLRKKIAYGKVIRINQRIAVLNQNIAELSAYEEKVQAQKGMLIAEMSVNYAIAKLEAQKCTLIMKRSEILEKYFNKTRLKGDENG